MSATAEALASMTQQRDAARTAHQSSGADHFAHDHCRWVGHAEALTTALEDLARGVLAEHVPIGILTCGYTTDGPVPHRHNGSTTSEVELIMVCSRPQGHEGDHQDAVCCWHFHNFTHEHSVPGQPRDLRYCTQCTGAWPCADATAAQEVLP